MIQVNNDAAYTAAVAWVEAENRILAQRGAVPRYHVITFGCQQNEADSERIRGMAEQMGYLPAKEPEDASLIVINTCAIREHAELRALSVIGRCKKIKERDRSVVIGVCGCMTAQARRVEQLKRSYPYVDFTLEPSSMHLLPQAVASVRREHRRRFSLGEGVSEAVEGMPIVRSARHRAYVSIMYGCNNFCSYCIVPYVRDRERSRDSGEIVNEVRTLIGQGARDITLLGQNVNSYRGDCDFPTLLSRLDALEGDFILRFMTSHPKDVSARLIEVIAGGRHIAPHFHLPVQSGNDRILARMNRHYDRAHYLATVEKLRRAMPDIAITSDIIVGFPGETEEEFSDTLSLIDAVGFDMVYSFIYSPRKGTPAAEMEDQISDGVKGERMRRLLETADAAALARAKPYEGKTLRVLVDGESKNGGAGMYSGRTDQNKLVHFAATPEDVGQFRRVRIERADGYVMHGQIIRES